jgi:hypothetical protein
MISIGIGIPFIKSLASGAAPLSARVDAFVTATGITDPTIISALSGLDTDLISFGLLPSGTGAGKIKALYPIVGGSATTHKYNFVNPLDTDAAFRLNFVGGWTHDSSGILPNGTNAYANTFIVPNTDLSLNSFHFSNYFPNFAEETKCQIGVSEAGPPNNGLYAFHRYDPTLGSIIVANANSNTFIFSDQTSNSGLRIVSRTASNLTKTYLNNTNTYSSVLTSSGRATYPIVISARNVASTIQDYSGLKQSFISVGDGLTDAEAGNLYDSAQAFQTILGRNV